MFVCVLHPFNSEVIYRRHPHLLSLAQDVKLGRYTVPNGNRTPDRHVAIHYATATSRKLHICYALWLSTLVFLKTLVGIFIYANMTLVQFLVSDHPMSVFGGVNF